MLDIVVGVLLAPMVLLTARNRLRITLFLFAPCLIGTYVAPAYSQDFQTMANDTGCQSRFSDDKKADIFATKYKGREITVTGEVQVLGSDRIGLRLLRSSTMSDVSIKLANPKEAYDLEKGQTVTIRFVPTDAGGCILPYYGDRGVISSKR